MVEGCYWQTEGGRHRVRGNPTRASWEMRPAALWGGFLKGSFAVRSGRDILWLNHKCLSGDLRTCWWKSIIKQQIKGGFSTENSLVNNSHSSATRKFSVISCLARPRHFLFDAAPPVYFNKQACLPGEDGTRWECGLWIGVAATGIPPGLNYLLHRCHCALPEDTLPGHSGGLWDKQRRGEVIKSPLFSASLTLPQHRHGCLRCFVMPADRIESYSQCLCTVDAL